MWKVQSQLCRRVLSSAARGCRAASTQPAVLAIRREDINVWEGRAPLAPRQVRNLVKSGVKVIVQPSNRRAYTAEDYRHVGAVVQEDIREASLIIGVKQCAIDQLIPNKTYAFFSHTIKAQDDNMAMLDAIMEKNIRLIDYERLVDENSRRLVAFGKYAGFCGMIDILHGMGVRLLALGHHTPFLHIGLAHNYRGTGMALQAVRDIGYEIALGSLPKSLGPLIFVFTGRGNVSQGAQDVFQELPFEYIEPEQLPKVARHGERNKVYGCVVSREDHYIRKADGGFDSEEFTTHPEKYISTFSQKIAPYATCIINGIYYAPGAPRLISIPDAKTLLQPKDTPWIPTSPGCPTLPHRLVAICDISADPGGSIEFMEECTTMDRPFCIYDADQHKNSENFDGDGVVICSIEQLPAQMPLEATDYFGSKLLPWIPDMLKSDAIKPFVNFSAGSVVKNAVIATNGMLADKYNYIADLRESRKSHAAAQAAARSASKRVLLLGSGYVSEPVVEYLTRDKTIAVTVASNSRSEAENLSNIYPNTAPKFLDIIDQRENVEEMIKDHDLVISMLPHVHHIDIAKLCIKYKTNMLTSSYIHPSMRELHDAAVNADITILNEMGLDPGIDHMLALECFDEIHEAGGKITGFTSYCGGLPSPELTNNPLRYKFSWSPVGVLRNVVGAARYLMDNKVVDISAGGTLMDEATVLDFFPGFNLEGLPNRDSTVYKELYGIQSAQTILRGSVRYAGFCNAMKGLIKLGFICDQPNHYLHPGGRDITWKEFMCTLVGKPTDIFVDTLRNAVFDHLDKDEQQMQMVEQLGLISDDVIDKRGTPVETLAEHLNTLLAFGPGERDLVVMRNLIDFQWSSGATEQRDTRLVVYGDPNGHSAMAKCVGYTAGIGAKMILEGEIQSKGVCMPKGVSMYRPMLQRLRAEGISATYTVN
ncbi:alpha-aminoadipic semialdehyde synthase, mitochondrial-like [Tubulanus polymorphus]|uniref:alpha-aminoadipic semialdehyde synthase, mitochondrial-like n=1 Tax=Tubulanus polymorphus TaxID=672921 RepID=UPI003DA482AD